MKTLLLLSVAFLFSINSLAQDDFKYKKDIRSQSEKEDDYNKYQSSDVSKIDILKALEFAGINIFKVKLTPFDKKYNLSVTIDEYENGEKIETVTFYQDDNTYVHFDYDDVNAEEPTPVYDYLDQLTFMAREEQEQTFLQMEGHFGSTARFLKKKKDRKTQSYNWRQYSKKDWKLNEYIPLLVYASSWFDERYDIERFCGVVDLSRSEEDTKELLDSSLHYYVIGYKIYE